MSACAHDRAYEVAVGVGVHRSRLIRCPDCQAWTLVPWAAFQTARQALEEEVAGGRPRPGT